MSLDPNNYLTFDPEKIQVNSYGYIYFPSSLTNPKYGSGSQIGYIQGDYTAFTLAAGSYKVDAFFGSLTSYQNPDLYFFNTLTQSNLLGTSGEPEEIIYATKNGTYYVMHLHGNINITNPHQQYVFLTNSQPSKPFGCLSIQSLGK